MHDRDNMRLEADLARQSAQQNPDLDKLIFLTASTEEPDPRSDFPSEPSPALRSAIANRNLVAIDWEPAIRLEFSCFRLERGALYLVRGVSRPVVKATRQGLDSQKGKHWVEYSSSSFPPGCSCRQGQEPFEISSDHLRLRRSQSQPTPRPKLSTLLSSLHPENRCHPFAA